MQQLRRASEAVKRGLLEQEKLPVTPRVIAHHDWLAPLSAWDEVSEDEEEDIEEASESEFSERHCEFAENEILVLSVGHEVDGFSFAEDN
eukprot:368279-Rhodomonas_salina.1